MIIPGFEVFLDDMELMIVWVKEKYPGIPIFILAHSMGGLIATHFGIRRLKDDPVIKGFIVSSPYYVNAINTPWIMQKMAGILSAIAPRMAVPLEDFVPYVTHDKEIYERHRKDNKDGVKAHKASARFASELLKAQAWVPENIAGWKYPILVIVAGDDKLANAEATRQLIGQIDEGLVTEFYYPENYHENFNELNRNEIFARILKWVETISI